MKPRTIATIVLLAFVAASVAYLIAEESRDKPADTPPLKAKQPSAPPGKPAAEKVVAFYFHGNMRCQTCRKIEAWSREAIETTFAGDLESRRLEWRVVNVDEPANEHFVKDYELTTRSVVVAQFAGAKQKAWKTLGRVWNLTGDEGAFKKYVADETAAYLKAVGQ